MSKTRFERGEAVFLGATHQIEDCDMFGNQTLYHPEANVYYEPFVCDDGRVGYRICQTDGSREVFIYLNPSTGNDSPNVFLYMGFENDPAEDEAQHWYGIDFDHPDLAMDGPA